MAEIESGADTNNNNNKKKKKLTAGGVVYRIVVVALLAVMAVSGFRVAKTYYGYYTARQEYKKVGELADFDPDMLTVNVDWEALHEINPEVCAWLLLGDSIINYPVAQTDNNDKYLHHLIDGSYNFSGTIFVDCSSLPNFEGFNTVVYGHHMKDGSMFAPLQKFITDPSYYEGHKQFELFTPDGQYHLQVFAAFVTDASSDVYNQHLSNDSQRQAHLDRLFSYNYLSTDVTVGPDDHIVTLSTCVDAEGTARYVVICKMVPWN